MVSSDFRKEAREKLTGKWGKAACITLAYMFIFMVLGVVEGLFSDTMQSFISLVIAIIEVPLALGLIISFVRLFNDDEVKTFDFLSSGFNNFGKSWAISVQICLKLIWPIVLMIVSYILISFGIYQSTISIFSNNSSASAVVVMLIGTVLLIASVIWNITKSYYYQLAYVVAAEKPELSAKEAVAESEKIMTGKRGKLFCLQLSFIGWAILGVFTLGIGYLWLVPYIQFAIVAFYKFVTGDNDDIETTIVEENNIEG